MLEEKLTPLGVFIPVSPTVPNAPFLPHTSYRQLPLSPPGRPDMPHRMRCSNASVKRDTFCIVGVHTGGGEDSMAAFVNITKEHNNCSDSIFRPVLIVVDISDLVVLVLCTVVCRNARPTSYE